MEKEKEKKEREREKETHQPLISSNNVHTIYIFFHFVLFFVHAVMHKEAAGTPQKRGKGAHSREKIKM